jgi:hypothetical protein
MRDMGAARIRLKTHSDASPGLCSVTRTVGAGGVEKPVRENTCHPNCQFVCKKSSIDNLL